MLYQLNYRPKISQAAAERQRDLLCFCLFVQNFFAAERAVLVLFQFALNVLAVFGRRVVLAFAFRTLKRDNINRCLFFAAHAMLLE